MRARLDHVVKRKGYSLAVFTTDATPDGQSFPLNLPVTREEGDKLEPETVYELNLVPVPVDPEGG